MAYCGRKRGQPMWRTLCDCGGSTIVSTWNLMRPTPPHSRSCGCLRCEQMRLKMKAAHSILNALVTSPDGK